MNVVPLGGLTLTGMPLGLEVADVVRKQPYTVVGGGWLLVQLTVNVTDPPGLADVLLGLIVHV